MDGKRLAEIRKKRRKKQRELADELGVYPDTISRYERGIIEPPDDMKIKICRFLDVKLDYLVGLTDKFEPLLDQPQAEESEKDSGLYFQSKEALAKEFINFLVFEERYDELTKEMLHYWSLLTKEQKQKLLQQLKRGM